MGKLDALFIDSFHDSLDEAVREAHRRKAGGETTITTVVETPYGGWRVRSIPAEFAVDLMADSLPTGTTTSRRVYG
ncbi:hypothetical protein H261_15230 [Paramagnetospirillum caucaseum]|uniref:Uncharacterized protein n=1 Tax=Paramagnetospirillum caucaseum TaxID=1244869 RepID=M2ZP82_9PROT|nr:hypothetical protein [Paramagnetospirillum caucaseum]EME69097.1 hypothetical protein H261_15230 [Paramagnetospirillum caucaseum]